ncbi:hypothetical protein P9112_004068 [Eukaryota sp. TZLM1-RC]
MSQFLLPHLEDGWSVDQAILYEKERLVIIRFGHDYDPRCMEMDETLYRTAGRLINMAVIYLVDITRVPDFNTMYELFDPLSVMFFWRNRHIMVDIGTGENNKLTIPLSDDQEFIDIVESVYRGASKGQGLVMAPRSYATRGRY